ncbi:MAG: TetR/AcrR family transcriptional regulator [Desulfatirhabdiaceae bacterium]
MSGNHKRQSIINAAREIIAEKGLKKTKISDIAQKAGVVDSIIYYYFKDKEDMLFCCLDEMMKKSTDELEFQLQGIVDPVSKIGKMVWYHIYLNDFSRGDTLILKKLLLQCRSRKDFYKHDSYSSLKEYTGKLMLILKDGVQNGVFRNDLNLVIIRDMIFGLLDEESLNCLAYQEVRKTTPDFEAIMSLITAMIVATPPALGKEIKIDKAQQILYTAKTVFAEKGYAKTTMMEIASDAGVSEGTIYEYFKNKEDLLFSIPLEQFTKYCDWLQATFHSDSPVIRLKRMIWYHFGYFLSDRQLLEIFLYDIKLNKEYYQSKAYTAYLQYVDLLNDILNDGKEQGVFRADVNNRVYRNLFMGSFSHLTMRWVAIKHNRFIDVMDEFKQTINLLCRAITTSEHLEHME